MGKGSPPDITIRKYYVNMQHVICLAPIDSIQEIRVDKKNVLDLPTGSEGFTDRLATIDKQELFGGDSREGGVAGKIEFTYGDLSQQPSPFLEAKFGKGNVPSYRLFVTSILRDFYVGLNYYLKPTSYVVRRVYSTIDGSAPWNTTTREPIVGQMNGVHIIHELLTNPYVGLGVPLSKIGDSFVSVATEAFNLGYGFSFNFNEGKSIDEYIKIVCAHLNAVVYIDRNTGKYQIKLIRNDYSVSSIPKFDSTNTIKLSNFKESLIGEIFSKVTLIYKDKTTYKDASVSVENHALSAIQGGVTEKKIELKGIRYNYLANAIALRELREVMSHTWSGDLTVTNLPLVFDNFESSIASDELNIGFPFVIKKEVNPYLDKDLVCRVVAIDLGTPTDNKKTITFIQDIFQDPDFVDFVGDDTNQTEFEDVVTPPVPIVNWMLTETPYYLIARTIGDSQIKQISNVISFVVTAASAPDLNSYEATMLSNDIAVDKLDFCCFGVLAGNLTKLSTTILIDHVTDIDLLLLDSFIQIGEEICLITDTSLIPDTNYDETNPPASLDIVIGIARGCLDTVPENHNIGTKCFAWEKLNGADNTQYTIGEDITVKLLTVTPAGELDEADADAKIITLAGRMHMPYPPANVVINELYWPATVPVSLTVTTVTILSLLFEDIDGAIEVTDSSATGHGIVNNFAGAVATAEFFAGTSSFSFNGFGFLTVEPSPEFDMLADFNISMQVFLPAIPDVDYLLFSYAAFGFSIEIYITSLQKARVIIGKNTGFIDITGTTTVALSTWTKVEVKRVGTTVSLVVGTTTEGTASDSPATAVYNLGATLDIGGNISGGNFIGYMDDFAITKQTTPGFPVAWSGRNRLTQTIKPIDFYFGNITKEVNTTYSLSLVKPETETVLMELFNINALDAMVYTSYKGNVRLDLWTENADYSSWHTVSHLFKLT